MSVFYPEKTEGVPEFGAWHRAIGINEELFRRDIRAWNDLADESRQYHMIPTGQEPYSLAAINIGLMEMRTFCEGDFAVIRFDNPDEFKKQAVDFVGFYVRFIEAEEPERLKSVHTAVKNFIPESFPVDVNPDGLIANNP